MVMLHLAARRRDGIGRRAGLKIPWWQHRMGSTPIAGTILGLYYDQTFLTYWRNIL